MKSGILSGVMCGNTVEADRLDRLSKDEGSHYSLTGILPALGATARNNRRGKLCRFIISPFHPYYRSLFDLSFTSLKSFFFFLSFLFMIILNYISDYGVKFGWNIYFGNTCDWK